MIEKDNKNAENIPLEILSLLTKNTAIDTTENDLSNDVVKEIKQALHQTLENTNILNMAPQERKGLLLNAYIFGVYKEIETRILDQTALQIQAVLEAPQESTYKRVERLLNDTFTPDDLYEEFDKNSTLCSYFSLKDISLNTPLAQNILDLGPQGFSNNINFSIHGTSYVLEIDSTDENSINIYLQSIKNYNDTLDEEFSEEKIYTKKNNRAEGIIRIQKNLQKRKERRKEEHKIKQQSLFPKTKEPSSSKQVLTKQESHYSKKNRIKLKRILSKYQTVFTREERFKGIQPFYEKEGRSKLSDSDQEALYIGIYAIKGIGEYLDPTLQFTQAYSIFNRTLMPLVSNEYVPSIPHYLIIQNKENYRYMPKKTGKKLWKYQDIRTDISQQSIEDTQISLEMVKEQKEFYLQIFQYIQEGKLTI